MDIKLIENCFNVVFLKDEVDGNNNVQTFAFASGLPNPMLKVVSNVINRKCKIILLTGLVEHIIYEGDEKEVSRRMKVVSMETSLKDDNKKDEYVWVEEDEES